MAPPLKKPKAQRTLAEAGDKRRDDFRTVVKYRSDLQRFLELRVGSNAIAMELTQETFERFLSMESTEKISSPRAYLFRIAANLAINHLRREKIYVVESEGCDGAGELHANDPSPEDWAEYADIRERFEAAYRALPVRHQEIFYLRRFDEMTTAEIAKKYGISRRMVQKYLARIMEHFREHLEK